MKTTNLYVLAIAAANLDINTFSKLEANLSGRNQVKEHKQHEIETLVKFVYTVFPYIHSTDLDGFAFTYEIPQL